MTEEELKVAFEQAYKELSELTPFEKPPAEEEVFRRTVILLRPETLKEIEGAKEFGDKATEEIHTIIYRLMQYYLETKK